MKWFFLFLLSNQVWGVCFESSDIDSIYSRQSILKTYPTYTYPYNDLENTLAKEGKKSLYLFSYGSLMSKKSAARTLSQETLKTYTYGLGFGIVRKFDRDVPIEKSLYWGIPSNDLARGMLNVTRSTHLKEFVNGVLFEIPLEEIQNLLRRETGYDLIPVIVAKWECFVSGIVKWEIAYTLSAPENSQYVSHDILPRPGYYELVRKAAMDGGALFELLWYETTFLANGEPIFKWETLCIAD